MKAPVIAIKRLRVNTDGIGIRTLVALKGCPLNCKYCINTIHSYDFKSVPMYSVQELLDIVKIDHVYYSTTNGGITFGGGEPLLHSAFIDQFMVQCPSEWNFCIETSLNVPWENISIIAEKVYSFYIDIKSMDPAIYNEYTSAKLLPVLNNLKMLYKTIGDKKIVVRVPIIENITSFKSIDYTISELKKIGISNIDVFQYRIF